MTRALHRTGSRRRTVGDVAELEQSTFGSGSVASSGKTHVVVAAIACPRRCCRRRRRAPDDVVVAAAVPQTMLSPSSAVPQTMLSSSAVPHTMLSQSAPPQSVPQTMLSSSSAVPQTMLSSSPERAPDDVVVVGACPTRCCRRRRRCPTRCCRRRVMRAPDDVVAVSPASWPTPQTMPSRPRVARSG